MKDRAKGEAENGRGDRGKDADRSEKVRIVRTVTRRELQSCGQKNWAGKYLNICFLGSVERQRPQPSASSGGELGQGG